MKKILLFVLIVLVGFSTNAQIATEQELRPDYNFSINKNADKRPVNLNHISGRDQNSFVSSSFDANWADRFQTVLDSVVAAHGVKGASAAVLVPGQGLWTGVSGISSEDEPITSEMRFGYGSNTKLFTAVVLAKLQEDGLLSLDDPLSEWIAEYPNIDPSITIRQLLLHHSGLFDFFNDRISMIKDSVWADTSLFWTAEHILETIGEPHFQPGNGFYYSNTNYLLAGMVIKSATGLSWVEKMREIIFDPLVMDSTFVGAFEPRNGPIANEWDAFNSNIEIVNSPVTSFYSMADAAGAILSTPQEMVKWYKALFNGDIISEASLQEVLDFETTSSYGLGVGLREMTGNQYYSHQGGTLGYVSQMAYHSKSKSVFSVVVNSQKYAGQWLDFNSFNYPLFDVLFNEYPKKEHDAGITEIMTPWEISCYTNVNPSVSLTNFGTEVLSSVSIRYRIDENEEAVYNWTGSLNQDSTIQVLLPEITADDGNHIFTCYTSLPNGTEEGYTYNDTSTSRFNISRSNSAITMLTESFDSPVFPPEGWSLSASSANLYSWGQTYLARADDGGSLVKTNYYDSKEGEFYDLNLPKIHISEGTDVIIDFSYAYAMKPGGFYKDSLQVLISDDCGNSWNKVYDKGGLTLFTAPNKNSPFYPQYEYQWRDESIVVDAFAGDILIKFRAINGQSNNLYIDDISVSFVTDINENNLTDNFKVYPNPASNKINVSGLPVGSEILITSLSGQVLINTKTTSDKKILDIHQLPKGVYIVRTSFGVEKIVRM